MEWTDVDFSRKEISITKSLDYTNGAHPMVKAPKTEAGTRTVPIIDPLYSKLLAEQERSSSPLIFPAQASTRGGKGGSYMTLRGYEGAWLRYCESAGFVEDGKPTLTAHNLRHGTATLMFELGVDELTAQRVLGHSRIEITREIYTELRAGQNAKSIKKFNNGMKKYLA